MSTDNFFDEQSTESLVKSTIVEKYFDAWAKVILSVIKRTRGRYKSKSGAEMGYIDLFAGPGKYDNGNPSTPILILQKILNYPELRSKIRVLFNDLNKDFAEELKKNINKLENINLLTYPPIVRNMAVGEDLTNWFSKSSLPPSLIFLDPWGYSGLTLDLLDAVLKDWGCDCIFFFNYNRINISLTNPKVQSHMEALFGKEKLSELQTEVSLMSSDERELTIMEEICQLLSKSGKRFNYVLPFRFKSQSGERTSHHLIFVSKNIKGYEIMKDIMAKESSDKNQGVASFEYNPAHERQPFLLRYSQPIEHLESILLTDFSGQKLKMLDIFNKHNVGTRFVKKNYKVALLGLEQKGIIDVEYPFSKRKRRAGEFSDKAVVQFPKQE